jgi:invasion protein IalB
MQRNLIPALVGALLFFAGVLVTLAVERAAPPNGGLASVIVYDDWRLGCPAMDDKSAAGSCELDQDVLDARTRTPLVHLAIGQTPAGRVLAITVPHNVLLPPGMALLLGKGPAKAAAYDFCDSSGCIAAIPMDAALEKSLRDADKGQVTIASLQGKPAGIPFSVHGVKDGLSALDKSAARRGSWWRRLFS